MTCWFILILFILFFFFFKQKTAYEMRISDWSSEVCSSDLPLCNDGKLALRGGRFGAFIACSNYPECKYTRKFGQPGGAENGEGEGPEIMGQHPETGLDIVRKSGRFGP